MCRAPCKKNSTLSAPLWTQKIVDIFITYGYKSICHEWHVYCIKKDASIQTNLNVMPHLAGCRPLSAAFFASAFRPAGIRPPGTLSRQACRIKHIPAVSAADGPSRQRGGRMNGSGSALLPLSMQYDTRTKGG